MLFVLIAIAWLAISVLCLGICAMAARGDGRGGGDGGDGGYKPAKPASAGTTRRKPAVKEGLTVWEGLPELAVRESSRRIAHGMR